MEPLKRNVMLYFNNRILQTILFVLEAILKTLERNFFLKSDDALPLMPPLKRSGFLGVLEVWTLSSEKSA